MKDAVGHYQNLVVFGGTSDIALATAETLVRAGTRRVILVGRPSPDLDANCEKLASLGAQVHTVGFDALVPEEHAKIVDEAFNLVNDVDLVLVAHGVLGDQEETLHDVDAVVAMATTNYVGSVSVLAAVAERLTHQGHGDIVVLSSVAGERPRRSNFIYGSTKAGLDSFALGLGDYLKANNSGVGVLVVRPGFVHSKMTAGLKPVPLSVTPEVVAAAILDGLQHQARIIWVPKSLRFVMSALRHLPQSIFRRLPI